MTPAPVACTAPVSLSRLLPGLSANVQNTAARLPLIAGRLEIVGIANGVTTDDEQTVHPGSDEHEVGILDRRMVGLLHLRQAGDPPAVLAQALGDQFGGLPRVSGEALDDQRGSHG